MQKIGQRQNCGPRVQIICMARIYQICGNPGNVFFCRDILLCAAGKIRFLSGHGALGSNRTAADADDPSFLLQLGQIPPERHHGTVPDQRLQRRIFCLTMLRNIGKD